jgi:hypothetical protein
METKARRQAVVLAVLLVALVVIAWWNLSSGLAPASAGPQGPRPRSATPQAQRADGAAANGPVDVALGALREARPEPVEAARNPFRFEARPAPPPPSAPPVLAGGATIGPGGVPVAGGPPGVQAAAPIPLKFIGIVEEPALHRRLAALSDGRFTYYGREGDIIEGRYRIVRIGVESIEMVHVDGRGPQTIRLSGS